MCSIFCFLHNKFAEKRRYFFNNLLVKKINLKSFLLNLNFLVPNFLRFYVFGFFIGFSVLSHATIFYFQMQ